MSINISAVQLTEPDFYALLNELVSTYNIAPKNVVLEITETQLVESFDRASSNLTALRDRGFTIAIDDFGTGYSSLSYLSNLPVGIIKIDQSFIQSMNTEKDLELVREMIRIGHNLKISVISEGVETKSQLEQLQKLHCEYIQGYLISRPMPADQTFTWIRSHNTVRTLQ
jgi:EAL domain-containing protein (putative c-di-GMP-specific phosphodiesterase class I)